MSIIYGVLLTIDGAICNFIDYVYDIFIFLASTNVFNEDKYNEIVSRIYVILGLIMLFVLTYSLLKAVIDPETFAKGEQSFAKLVKNVVVSLIIIVVLPLVFNVAFNIQNTILYNNTIPKLLLGTEYKNEVSEDAGREMAYQVFSAFFHPDAMYCTDGESDKMDNNVAVECKDKIISNGANLFFPSTWINIINKNTLTFIDQKVLEGNSFTLYSRFSESVASGYISYTPLISTAALIFLLYVLLNFCFDLAVRVIKLIFYEIIAPIPVICRIIPGGKMKDVFSKWTKQVISIYLEVIIRVGVMYIGIFAITLLIDYEIPGLNNLSFTQKYITVALLIMGVIIFIRQAPKLLGDILNLDTGGMKLGLMDKLAMGGGLVAGAALGGGLTSAVRNFAAIRTNGGNRIDAFKSALGGAGSGLIRGGFAGKGAKNFKDVSVAAAKGAQGADVARRKRAANDVRYKAENKSYLKGKITDVSSSIKDWATGGIGQFEEKIKMGNDFKSAGDAVFSEAEKIMQKNINNVDMVAKMTSFKGDVNNQLLNLYNEYSGMSLAAIDADINRQANITDFSTFVDKNSFYQNGVFDATAYQNAIDAVARNHAVKVSNLRNMYAQLEKATKFKVVNVALNDNMNISGIDDEKLKVIRDKADTFKEQYSQVGSTVHDPAANKTYSKISSSGDIADEIDKIATAFSNISSEASVNAAKYKQAMEARKGK